MYTQGAKRCYDDKGGGDCLHTLEQGKLHGLVFFPAFEAEKNRYRRKKK
jgi:hypothetical protein